MDASLTEQRRVVKKVSDRKTLFVREEQVLELTVSALTVSNQKATANYIASSRGITWVAKSVVRIYWA